MSHNAAFDRRYVPASVVGDKPWLCSCHDVVWPKQRRKGEGLATLARAHGVVVASVHRAYADVDILARLLARVAETVDLRALLGAALERRLARS